jgi:hypothetical protein
MVYIGGVTSTGTLISLSVKMSPIGGSAVFDIKSDSREREWLAAALCLRYSTILRMKGLF